MFSFENFPEKASNAMRMTPRSHEALKRTGLTIDDVLVKTTEEINAKYGDTVTEQSLLEKRIAHH